MASRQRLPDGDATGRATQYPNEMDLYTAPADQPTRAWTAVGDGFPLGSIDRVTNRVFLLCPANVEVTAEDKARIAERGFFNQS